MAQTGASPGAGAVVLAAALASALCVAAPVSAWAGEPLRVLVLGEDGHPGQLNRNHPAFQRVLHALQDQMARHGFEVVDEDMLAAQFDWSWVDWRRKDDLMRIVETANASGSARARVRALATFSIDLTHRDLRFTRRYRIQVRGQIYDALSNRFLGSYEVPPQTVSGSYNCELDVCAGIVVGDRARDLAAAIGSVLARRLADLAAGQPAESEGRGDAVGGIGGDAIGATGGGSDSGDDIGGIGGDDIGGAVGETVGGASAGLYVRYTVTMRHLDPSETLQLIGVMTEEFPGYRSHNLMHRAGDMRRYAYVTDAPPAKLERWLHMLLLDMDLRPGEEIELSVDQDQIIVERLAPSARRERSTAPILQ